MNFDLRLLRNLDYWLLMVVLTLAGLGVAVIASATRGPESVQWNQFVLRQVIGILLGLMAMAVVLLFDYSEFGRMYRFLYVLNLLLLAVLFVPGVGKRVHGALSWIDFGPFQFQPAELSKVILILTLARLLEKQEHLTGWWEMLPGMVHVAPTLVLVLAQPDLGTAMVLVAILAGMLYMAGVPGWRFVAAGALAVAVAVGLAYAHVKMGMDLPLPDHQIKRLACWIYPDHDVRDACYNINQSMIAIGSGGLWGRGYGNGTQTQLRFVPEHHTDFIFAVIGEELGFVGGATVVLLFLVLIYRILQAAIHAKDRYGMLICSGVAAMVAFHVVENIGMSMGIMPVTGIPLPFLSYGPSAVVANLTAVGLVLNVHMRRQKIMF